jgi:membrane associated rhomboid family serine protease
LINQLWQDARSGTDVGDRACPACDRKMKVVPLADTGNLYVDVCLGCHFIWFDPHEFEKVSEADQRLIARQELSPVSKAALARAEIKLLQEQRKAEYASADPPDSWWEITLTVFGLPVEYDNQGISERPIITWSLSALMVLVYAIAFSDLHGTAEKWGLVPADLFRHYGLTFISSFFLHGGLFHLLGNLYFFLVFGDNVEDEMGRSGYLLLLAASALVGDVFHILGDPRSTTPLVGASGGISGIIVYYALQFPKTRIGMLIFFRWYRIPVGWLLILWLAAQVLGALQQVSGFGNVSALAHLGGASVGFLFWLHSRQFSSQGSRGRVASQA